MVLNSEGITFCCYWNTYKDEKICINSEIKNTVSGKIINLNAFLLNIDILIKSIS